jgi:diguanylate cyclase (GGDEF)-like protein
VLQQKIGKLSLDSLTDPLSGLLNRRGMDITLEQWQARRLPFAVIAVDIDHFKRINDLHGHDQGDQAIRYLATLMRQSSRSEDVLCRSGGEEFIMLLPAVNLDAARQVAERLRLQVQDSTAPGGVHFTLSAGVACWPGDGEQADSVLKRADQALYTAKEQGRNRVETASTA